MQALAPAGEYFPALQAAWLAATEPAKQKYPAVQFPLQADDAMAVEAPYVPLGHKVHTEDPDTLY